MKPQPREDYVHLTRVWVADPRDHPNKIEYQQAVKIYEGISGHQPLEGPAADEVSKAESLVNAGNYKEALDHYRRASQADPENVSVLMPYALLCSHLDMNSEAIGVARNVLKQKPTEVVAAAAYTTLVEALRAEGEDPSMYEVLTRRSVYVTDDPEAAWAQIAPYIVYQTDAYIAWANPGVNAATDASRSPEERARQTWIIGTPAQVIAAIEELQRTLGLTELLSFGVPPGLPPALMLPAIERFAREVLPHFRQSPVGQQARDERRQP